MKTVAYMRISDKGQEAGNGIEQQRISILAWALHNNVQIDEWVSETVTGTTADREEITRLLTEASQGSLTRLVVDRLDRFARKLVVSEQLYAQFTAAGVEVVAATVKLEDSPTGNLVRQLLGSVAEFQRAEWLGRMKQAKAASIKRRGSFRGGRAATGFRSVGGGALAIDDRGADLVRLCHQLRSSGASLRNIVDVVHTRGFRTSNNTRIEVGTIHKILKREAVYRSRVPAGSPAVNVPGAQPAILTEGEPPDACPTTVTTQP